ncbi:MAG: tripartite tricarboxylate transporter TctB family protein [Pseudomonadota bacterium]
MFERGLNITWCLIGIGTMVNAYSLGLIGPSGPESGLFPLMCGAIITLCGIALLLGMAPRVDNPGWPRGAAIGRVAGVVGGLVSMAITLPYLGFAVSSAITTFVLLQTVERSRLLESLALTIGSVAAVMYIFGQLLGMSLPRGPWGW